MSPWPFAPTFVCFFVFPWGYVCFKTGRVKTLDLSVGHLVDRILPTWLSFFLWWIFNNQTCEFAQTFVDSSSQVTHPRPFLKVWIKGKGWALVTWMNSELRDQWSGSFGIRVISHLKQCVKSTGHASRIVMHPKLTQDGRWKRIISIQRITNHFNPLHVCHAKVEYCVSSFKTVFILLGVEQGGWPGVRIPLKPVGVWELQFWSAKVNVIDQF